MTTDPEALAKEYEKIEEEISYEHLEDIDWTGRDTKIESMRRLIAAHPEWAGRDKSEKPFTCTNGYLNFQENI